MTTWTDAGAPASTILDNDGFWPDADTQTVAAVLGINNGVTTLQLEQAVLNAMLSLNREVRPLKRRWRAEGYNTLAEVPAQRLHGHSLWLALYRRALYCATGAQLFREGSHDDDANPPLTGNADDYRRAYRQALNELQGSGHIALELT